MLINLLKRYVKNPSVRTFGRKFLLLLSENYRASSVLFKNGVKLLIKQPADVVPEIMVVPGVCLGLRLNESYRVASLIKRAWDSHPEKMRELTSMSQDREISEKLQSFFVENSDMVNEEIHWLTGITKKSLKSDDKTTAWSTMALILLSKQILCEKIEKRLFPATTYSRPSPFVYMMQ